MSEMWMTVDSPDVSLVVEDVLGQAVQAEDPTVLQELVDVAQSLLPGGRP